MYMSAQSFTFATKRFDDVDSLSVEHFFSIDGHTVTLNQVLVDSTSIIEMDKQSASIILNLKDGTTISKRFSIDAAGIVEHKTPAPPSVLN